MPKAFDQHNLLSILAFVLATALFNACSTSLPTTPEPTTKKIQTGPGPEDIVLDTFDTRERLLIACSDRRDDARPEGGIYSYDLQGNCANEMDRKGEPDQLTLRPHGIDIVKSNGGDVLLYVVSHPAHDGDPEKIVKYRVEDDRLVFQERLTNPEHLISPNDLSVMPDGSMYITNDHGKRTSFGQFWEMLFAMRAASVVHYDGEGKWQEVVDRIAFGNGIFAEEDTLYVATTRKDGLLAFTRNEDGTVSNRTQIVDLKGIDNLSQTGKGDLLTAAHPNFIAFKQHAGDAANPSPGIIYRMDPHTGEAEAIYANKGEEISANSSALYYKGHLYIGQVFESYMLKRNASDLY